jgi:Nuclease-related domain
VNPATRAASPLRHHHRGLARDRLRRKRPPPTPEDFCCAPPSTLPALIGESPPLPNNFELSVPHATLTDQERSVSYTRGQAFRARRPGGRYGGTVLLLINPDTELSAAEQRFAEWVRWSPAQHGVVLLNVAVPHRGHTRQLDALIWTRQRAIAVEIKGFRSHQHGALVVPPNGPWLMSDGRVADLYGNSYNHNPISQVRTNTLAVKNWAGRTLHRGCFVYGLVIVMLLPGQQVPSLHVSARPEKIDIVVEDFDVFRYYLHRLSTQRVTWTAAEVDTLLTGLGVAHLYHGRRDLLTAALGEPIRHSPAPAGNQRRY